MDTAKPINITTHFRYLDSADHQKTLDFLKEFCNNRTEIELFRKDLLDLFKAACTDIHARDGKHYKNPSDYVFTHKQAIEIIELLWSFAQQKDQSFYLTESHPLFQKKWIFEGIDTDSRLKGMAKHYRQLENEEINNIYIFLDDLFTYKNLSEWRETLDYLLHHAHSREGYGSGTDDCIEIIPIMEYLEKIAEGVFLIAEIIRLKEDGIEDIDGPDHYKNEKMVGPHFLDSLISYFQTYGELQEENIYA